MITTLRSACEARRIYLYGAGMYGKILYAFMKEQGIGQIEKFIVSEPEEQRTVFGEKIITLEEYISRRSFKGKAVEEDLIIVAVSGKYSDEIVRLLENKKLSNFITLTQKEWDAIEKATLFEGITPKKNIAVLMYHRIIDSNYNFWKLNVSPESFERHIKYISENYKVLKLDEDWSDIVKADQKYIVITFDDGYVDNYRFALPILEKYHVPATFFVSTDLIDTKEMYWWDELEKIFIIDKYIGEFEFEGILYSITDSNDSINVCLTIRNRIKNMAPIKRKESMEKLRLALRCGQPVTSELRCVNTAELARMAKSPYITIGGHTKSHLSMGNIHSKELLCSEMEESLGILEEKTGKKIDVFAYPFGGEEDRCDTADQIMSACGIKKSMLVKNGNINVSDKMYNLPRHMVFDGEDIEKKLGKIWGLYG